MPNPEGRPRRFTTPADLQTAVDVYFATEERITLSGLALALDISRQTLLNYGTYDEGEYLDIIKKARERVEARYEARLIYDNQPTGVIFALKNMDWKDKTEQDLQVTGSLIWNEQKTYIAPGGGTIQVKGEPIPKMLTTKGGDIPQ